MRHPAIRAGVAEAHECPDLLAVEVPVGEFLGELDALREWIGLGAGLGIAEDIGAVDRQDLDGRHDHPGREEGEVVRVGQDVVDDLSGHAAPRDGVDRSEEFALLDEGVGVSSPPGPPAW